MEELISAIQELNQPGCIDYIQVIATIISIGVSIAALIFAIRVPKKIAKEQNKISLFEKRYELFQCYEAHTAFARSLKEEHKIEQMICSCKDLFCFNCKSADKDAIVKFIFKIEYDLHKMLFLYPDISDDDVNEMYTSFYRLILCLVPHEMQEDDLKKLEVNKENYIRCVDGFMKKYQDTIFEQTQLYSVKKR